MATAAKQNSGATAQFKTSLLMTTALTVAGLLVSTVAYADPAANELPTGFNLSSGSVNAPTVSGATMGIQQNSLNAVVNWNTFNIGQNATVNINQTQGANSLLVNRVSNTTVNKTQIFGTLNANGQVMILDRNGVLIGKNASVNVAGLIASTGTLDSANEAALMSGKSFTLSQTDANPDARIENQGTVNIAEAGLLAFVAPYVSNSGTINATLGKVTLASGKKVTVDLTGDDLITIAADDMLTKAYTENSGAINANGGHIVMTASAAGDAVNSVVNMTGVARADSFAQQAGKIVLSSTGNVTVSGTVSANGGGEIDLSGYNLFLDATSLLSANGSGEGEGGGGNICVVADNYAIAEGEIDARGGDTGGNGGFVETSGTAGVLFDGLVDTSAANGQTGTFLLDPVNINIGSYGSLKMAADIAADLLSGGKATTVDIDSQALANTLGSTNVDLWATKTISTTGTGNIDLSTWQGLFGSKGITTHDLTLSADTIDINNNIILGTGTLYLNDIAKGQSPLGIHLINAPSNITDNTLNLNGMIETRGTVGGTASVASDSQIDGEVRTVNVLSNKAIIQQGISFAKTDATVNVDEGIYQQDVVVDKEGLQVLGFDATIEPASPGFKITDDNVTVSGFTIDGSSSTSDNGYGIWVDHANGVTLTNNMIENTQLDGIFADTSNSLTVQGNTITNTGTVNADSIQYFNSGSGIQVLDSTGATIGGSLEGQGNTITTTTWDGIRLAGNGGTATVTDNVISGVKRIGIWMDSLANSSATGNHISGSTGDGDTDLITSGILVADGSSDITLTGNWIDNISNVTGATKADGIQIGRASDVQINDNQIGQHGGGITGDGINIIDGTSITVSGNTVGGFGYNGVSVTPSSGITLEDITIEGNTVSGGVTGINVSDTNTISILGNTVSGASADGIDVTDSNNITIASYETGKGKKTVTHDNWIYNVGGKGISVVGALEGSEGLILTTNLSIDDNKVETTGQDGIYVANVNGSVTERSDSVEISGNHVGHAAGDGIGIDDSSNVTVDGNYVHDSGMNGISVDPSSHIYITDNTIDASADDGIFGDNDTDLEIKGNTITNSGTAHTWDDYASEKGSGIEVQNSTGTIVGGTGRHDGNTIIGTEWDGVRITGTTLSSATVIDNVIKNVGRVGVWLSNMSSGTASGNTITDTGLFGMGSDFNQMTTSNLTFSNNTINNTGLRGVTDPGMEDGIKIDGVAGVTITGNHIGTHGGNDNIAGDGVGVYNSSNVKIAYNTITHTVDNGVFVDPSTNVTIAHNDITGAGLDGIDAEDVTNLGIYHNDVKDSGDDGIDVSGSDHVKIKKNKVSDSGEDGIRASTSKHIDIVDNNVRNSRGNGIEASKVRDLNIAGNDIDDSKRGDGIKISDSKDVGIFRNDIERSGEDGIDVSHSKDVKIAKNNIRHSRIDGIDLRNTDDVTVSHNFITQSGNDGVSVRHSDDVTVASNHVFHSRNTGIFVDPSNNITISGNTVAGDTIGIDSEGNGIVSILNNIIKKFSDAGIQAFGNDSVTITGNTITGHHDLSGGDDEDDQDESDTGTTGIRINDNGDVNLSGNTVNGNHIGLDASQFDNGTIELSNNTFNDNFTGAWFGSGLIDLTGETNTFNGGDTDLLFQRAEKSVPGGGDEGDDSDDEGFRPEVIGGTTVFADLKLVGDTIGTTVFTGQTSYYVDLENGAFLAPGNPTIIDGTQATFDGVFGGLMTSPELAAIEAKIHDFADDHAEGLFFPGGTDEDNSDIFQIVNGGSFNPSSPFVIITGLPNTGGGGGTGGAGGTTTADLNNIETAAGGDLPGIEPAAGGNATSVACWGKVGGSLTGKNVVSINLSGDAESVLNAETACGGT